MVVLKDGSSHNSESSYSKLRQYSLSLSERLMPELGADAGDDKVLKWQLPKEFGHEESSSKTPVMGGVPGSCSLMLTRTLLNTVASTSLQ